MADTTVKTSKLQNVGKGFSKFVKEVTYELKKVIWPNREQLFNNTSTVLLACLFIGAIIWIADYALVELSKLVFIK